MAWWLAFWKAARLCELLSRHQRTSAGSSETAEKELMVRPMGCPSGSMAVTTATPVAKRPRALRRVRLSDWA